MSQVPLTNARKMPEGHSRRMQRNGMQCWWLYQPGSICIYRRALSRNQGQRYHSDIQHIYILHDRPLASSDSRTTDSVERLSDTPCTCSPRLVASQNTFEDAWGLAVAGIRRAVAESIQMGSSPDESTLLENARPRKVEVVLTVLSVPVLGHEFAIVVAPSLHLAITPSRSPRDHFAFLIFALRSRLPRFLFPASRFSIWNSHYEKDSALLFGEGPAATMTFSHLTEAHVLSFPASPAHGKIRRNDRRPVCMCVRACVYVRARRLGEN